MSNLAILNKVRELLGMEVKLEQRKLDDGVTIIEAEVFESGAEVVVITEDEQRIALPIGEYKMDDGMMLVVAEEGIIAEVKEAGAAEEEEVVEEEAGKDKKKKAYEEKDEEMQNDGKPIKKSVESIVKETYFEEIERLTEENIKLKSQLESKGENLDPESKAKKELSTEDKEPAAKPIAHNPENKSEVEKVLFSQNRNETTLDRVLKKLNK